MHNLSTPVGLIAEKSYVSKAVGIVSDATLDPMPPYPGALIRTEKGVRKLRNNKYCQSLGYTKEESEQVPEKLCMLNDVGKGGCKMTGIFLLSIQHN